MGPLPSVTSSLAKNFSLVIHCVYTKKAQRGSVGVGTILLPPGKWNIKPPASSQASKKKKTP